MNSICCNFCSRRDSNPLDNGWVVIDHPELTISAWLCPDCNTTNNKAIIRDQQSIKAASYRRGQLTIQEWYK